MSVRSEFEKDLLEAGSTGAMLDAALRYLAAFRHDPETPVRAMLALTHETLWFAESLNDALCLYLQRQTSAPDSAGHEFEPIIGMLAALRGGRAWAHLMCWIDRHREVAAPTEDRERRFALAIWALMRIRPVDSRTFVTWWTERVRRHRQDWLGRHFTPEAVPILPARTPQA